MRKTSKVLIDSQNHLTSDRRLTALILYKAAAAYFCLVDRCEKERNYGSCLRYLRLALNCYSKSRLDALPRPLPGHCRCPIETAAHGSR